MRKCANIYIRRPLVIYDFATDPFSVSLYMRKIWFYFFISELYIIQANLPFGGSCLAPQTIATLIRICSICNHIRLGANLSWDTVQYICLPVGGTWHTRRLQRWARTSVVECSWARGGAARDRAARTRRCRHGTLPWSPRCQQYSPPWKDVQFNLTYKFNVFIWAMNNQSHTVVFRYYWR